mmetsp:Transcript_17331/g.45239  ORF Transcript_17331/g.45239 Transcript_17331/m.45239 type:complete len:207 (-) Transcript_17331:199-819(-)
MRRGCGAARHMRAEATHYGDSRCAVRTIVTPTSGAGPRRSTGRGVTPAPRGRRRCCARPYHATSSWVSGPRVPAALGTGTAPSQHTARSREVLEAGTRTPTQLCLTLPFSRPEAQMATPTLSITVPGASFGTLVISITRSPRSSGLTRRRPSGRYTAAFCLSTYWVISRMCASYGLARQKSQRYPQRHEAKLRQYSAGVCISAASK